MKGLFSIAVFALTAIALSSCTESDDLVLKPLDSIEVLFGRTWKFQSVTLTQDSITATTSNCARTQLAEAGFKNDYWQLADEQDITFQSADRVNYNNLCTLKSYELTANTSENEDGTVNVFFTDPKGKYPSQKFVIARSEITEIQFKAYLINTYSYTVVYVFTRE